MTVCGVAIKRGPESHPTTYWIDYDENGYELITTKIAPVFPFLTKQEALNGLQEYRNTVYPSGKAIHSARLYEFQPEPSPFEDIDLTTTKDT